MAERQSQPSGIGSTNAAAAAAHEEPETTDGGGAGTSAIRFGQGRGGPGTRSLSRPVLLALKWERLDQVNSSNLSGSAAA